MRPSALRLPFDCRCRSPRIASSHGRETRFAPLQALPSSLPPRRCRTDLLAARAAGGVARLLVDHGECRGRPGIVARHGAGAAGQLHAGGRCTGPGRLATVDRWRTRHRCRRRGGCAVHRRGGAGESTAASSAGGLRRAASAAPRTGEPVFADDRPLCGEPGRRRDRQQARTAGRRRAGAPAVELAFRRGARRRLRPAAGRHAEPAVGAALQQPQRLRAVAGARMEPQLRDAARAHRARRPRGTADRAGRRAPDRVPALRRARERGTSLRRARHRRRPGRRAAQQRRADRLRLALAGRPPASFRSRRATRIDRLRRPRPDPDRTRRSWSHRRRARRCGAAHRLRVRRRATGRIAAARRAAHPLRLRRARTTRHRALPGRAHAALRVRRSACVPSAHVGRRHRRATQRIPLRRRRPRAALAGHRRKRRAGLALRVRGAGARGRARNDHGARRRVGHSLSLDRPERHADARCLRGRRVPALPAGRAAGPHGGRRSRGGDRRHAHSTRCARSRRRATHRGARGAPRMVRALLVRARFALAVADAHRAPQRRPRSRRDDRPGLQRTNAGGRRRLRRSPARRRRRAAPARRAASRIRVLRQASGPRGRSRPAGCDRARLARRQSPAHAVPARRTASPRRHRRRSNRLAPDRTRCARPRRAGALARRHDEAPQLRFRVAPGEQRHAWDDDHLRLRRGRSPADDRVVGRRAVGAAPRGPDRRDRVEPWLARADHARCEACGAARAAGRGGAREAGPARARRRAGSAKRAALRRPRPARRDALAARRPPALPLRRLRQVVEHRLRRRQRRFARARRGRTPRASSAAFVG